MKNIQKINFDFLKGKIFKDIILKRNHLYDNDSIEFITETEKFILYHDQDCCEDVKIEDIDGDIKNLIGHEILLAEDVSNRKENNYKSETWTFYKLRTIKGSVTIRWYGTSNGYYSETAELYKSYSLNCVKDLKNNIGLNVHFSNAFRYFYQQFETFEGRILSVIDHEDYFSVKFLIGYEEKEFYFSKDKDISKFFEN